MHIVTGVTACVFLYLVFYLHHSDLKLHLHLTFHPLYSVSSSATIMCNSELRFFCRIFKYFKVWESRAWLVKWLNLSFNGSLKFVFRKFLRSLYLKKNFYALLGSLAIFCSNPTLNTNTFMLYLSKKYLFGYFFYFWFCQENLLRLWEDFIQPIAGIIHIMVPWCVQLCHCNQHGCIEFEYRWTWLLGYPVCGEGKMVLACYVSLTW